MSKLKIKIKSILLCGTLSILLTQHALAIENTNLTNINYINITNEMTKNKKEIKKLIKIYELKAIIVEQWILLEPHNKKLLKYLHKHTKKSNIKLFLTIGKNTWFGRRGLANASASLKEYGKNIDGLILRLEPNKTNVWKDDISIKAQILNQMLDAYSAILIEAKKQDKKFIAEFPFWFTDFEGPLKSFSQNVCDFSNEIVFLIDDLKQLDELQINWNNVSCRYSINLGKRATGQSDEKLKEIFNKLNSKLSFYSNFAGFILDSDSSLINTNQK